MNFNYNRDPYGNPNPNYPPQQGQIYPNIYNPTNAPPPGQPGGQPGYPVPGYNVQHTFQPVYGAQPPSAMSYPSAPQGQPPSAMSYPSAPQGQPPQGQPPQPGFGGYQPYPYPQPNYNLPVEWIPSTPQSAPSLSERAVVGGYEGHDGSPLWVIRAKFQGDVIPGKLCVKHFCAYVPWGGKENAVQNIEVCCVRPERIRWLESRDGNIPPNAVVGGNTANGEPLYIGRAREQGSLTPGKVHPSHKSMYISFAGNEIPHKVYEILVTV